MEIDAKDEKNSAIEDNYKGEEDKPQYKRLSALASKICLIIDCHLTHSRYSRPISITCSTLAQRLPRQCILAHIGLDHAEQFARHGANAEGPLAFVDGAPLDEAPSEWRVALPSSASSIAGA